MAKPIRATPVLRGAEAEAFVNEMISVQNRKPNKIEKHLSKIVN